jgi:hypothetical protein
VHAIYDANQRRNNSTFTSPKLTAGWRVMMHSDAARECQPIYVNPAHAEDIPSGKLAGNCKCTDDQFANKTPAPAWRIFTARARLKTTLQNMNQRRRLLCHLLMERLVVIAQMRWEISIKNALTTN